MLGCQTEVMTPVESTTQPPVEEPNRSDLTASEEVLRQLAPDVDGEVIEGLVQTAYDDLMPAKVDSYVPILIVHEVRDILRLRQTA